jgi:hypothetical protein
VKGYFGKSLGFTTPEILVALVFVMILLASLYGFYRNHLFTLLSQETKTAALEDVRGALDLMVRELRNAGSWSSGVRPAGCSKIVSATSSAIRIQADLDGNGDCSSLTGEEVTYRIAPGTATCPGLSIRRNGDCLVSNVVIPAGNEFLTYYSAGGSTALTHPISELSNLKRIRIAFSVRLPSPHPDRASAIVSTLSSSVELRN